MRIIKHILHQPFVFATGLAALIHSTWTIGTFFNGPQPSGMWESIMWLIPAFLIAFSLDVGQIVTSAEIRAGQKTRSKYLTFAVFAAATYYLQFMYIAHHMPVIDLGIGVRGDWHWLVNLISDACIFGLPALMPASTLLYTFSQRELNVETVSDHNLSLAVPPQTNALVPVAPSELVQTSFVDGEFIADPTLIEMECDHPGCTWANRYDNPLAAKRGLVSHKRTHKIKSLVESE